MSTPRLVSVNIGPARPMRAKSGRSGIDKRPIAGPVAVAAPEAGSGLAGDAVCDRDNHGGPDQAVYAYAEEDLDGWGLGLPPGTFGENLTTRGLEVTGAEIGEHWLVGSEVLLEVSSPRIPCRTFAEWMARPGWTRAFVERGAPGAYLRVLRPGSLTAGDPVRVVRRPGHGVTVGLTFRATTTEPDLLPRLLAAPELPGEILDRARRCRTGA